MVSHVDFLPTLASLVNAPRSARANWQGVDYSDHILERLAPPPQDYVVFTYDDYQAGQTRRPVRQAATAHHQPAGAPLEDRRVLRRQRQGSPASGRCTTSSTTRSSAQPRAQGPQANASTGEAVSAPAAQARASKEAAPASAARHTRAQDHGEPEPHLPAKLDGLGRVESTRRAFERCGSSVSLPLSSWPRAAAVDKPFVGVAIF